VRLNLVLGYRFWRLRVRFHPERRCEGTSGANGRFEHRVGVEQLLRAGSGCQARQAGAKLQVLDRSMGGLHGAHHTATQSVTPSGARSIYVSATPSASAVGFYLPHGCEVVPVPHAEFYAAEPGDVHLVAVID
jgi:hypothetical protein